MSEFWSFMGESSVSMGEFENQQSFRKERRFSTKKERSVIPLPSCYLYHPTGGCQCWLFAKTTLLLAKVQCGFLMCGVRHRNLRRLPLPASIQLPLPNSTFNRLHNMVRSRYYNQGQ